MPAAITNSAEGTATTQEVIASFGFTATADRLLVLTWAGNDYAASTPTGWTAGPFAAGNVGHYIYWKVAAGGETSVTYNLSSGAFGSAWTVVELSGIVTASPLDVSSSSEENTATTTTTSAALVPTTGPRYIVISFGGACFTAAATDVTGVTNSFTIQRSAFTVDAGQTTDYSSHVDRSVTGDGTTSFTSVGTHASADGRSALSLAFIETAATGQPASKRIGGVQFATAGAFQSVKRW